MCRELEARESVPGDSERVQQAPVAPPFLRAGSLPCELRLVARKDVGGVGSRVSFWTKCHPASGLGPGRAGPPAGTWPALCLKLLFCLLLLDDNNGTVRGKKALLRAANRRAELVAA